MWYLTEYGLMGKQHENILSVMARPCILAVTSSTIVLHNCMGSAPKWIQSNPSTLTLPQQPSQGHKNELLHNFRKQYILSHIGQPPVSGWELVFNRCRCTVPGDWRHLKIKTKLGPSRTALPSQNAAFIMSWKPVPQFLHAFRSTLVPRNPVHFRYCTLQNPFRV